MSIVITAAALLPLIYAAVMDIRARTIPDLAVITLLVIAIIKTAIGLQSFISLLYGLLLAAMFFAIALLCGEGKIGGGDVKLLSAICIFCGGWSGAIIFIIAAIIIFFAWLLKHSKHMPMAPAMLGAFVIFHIIQFVQLN